MNEAKGNMYSTVAGGKLTHTHNDVMGACQWSGEKKQCEYCYNHWHWQLQGYPEVRLSERALREDLYKQSTPEERNFIFMGSSTDVWGPWVPDDWIKKVLDHCRKFPENRYLFQSKNPERFRSAEFTISDFPPKFVLCTTIESNRSYPEISPGPRPELRAEAMSKLQQFETMITIEPVMKFDLEEFVEMIQHAAPKWVAIGADSKDNHLPEPTRAEVEALISRLEASGITVERKANLGRLG